MAAITKSGSGWRAQVYVKGVRRSKVLPTKAEAQEWALNTELELKSGKQVKQGVTLADALTRYRNEVSPTKKGGRWEDVRIGKFLRDSLANLSLEKITTHDIDIWISKQTHLKGSSINRELHLLSSVFEKAIKWRWCSDNPVTGCERPAEPPPRVRRISDSEVSQILDAIGQSTQQRIELGIAFQFAIETAMRQGEIFGLQWERVHYDQRYLVLFDTKNGDRREVPLSSQAIALLKKLPQRNEGRCFQFNQASSAQIFRRSVKMAGIENLTFHDTRHEALTRLARKLDVLDLARMVGHRDPRSLMIYYNPTASEIAKRLG